jgi:hypothetical protein
MDTSSLADTAGTVRSGRAETGHRPLIIHARKHLLVLALFVLAVAADLDFFTSRGLAIVAAKLFAFRDRALAGLMCALLSFFVSHFALFLLFS